MLRFGDRAGDAIGFGGGWVVPVGLSAAYIPGLGATVTAWLPAPVTAEALALPQGPGINHLVWSAVAGAGIGLALRSGGPRRLLGVIPLLALGLAVWFDLRWLRRRGAAHPELVLAREQGPPPSRLAALARYALLRPPWTALLASRAVPAALRDPDGPTAARLQLKIAIAAGAMVLGIVSVGSWLIGTDPGAHLLPIFHVLDALSDLLLLGAFIFFPPLGLAVAPGVGAVLVPTVTAGFVTMGTLGLSGILLSQAVASAPAPSPGSGGRGGGSGGQHVPDLPRQPPAPRPQVRHWRLRNIVDELWKGSMENSSGAAQGAGGAVTPSGRML